MTDNAGYRLKQARLAAGFTQAQLAEVVNRATGLNWQQSTVQKNETGGRPLTLTDLEALSQVFGMGLDDLLYGDEIARENELGMMLDDPMYDMRAYRVGALEHVLIFEIQLLEQRVAEKRRELAALRDPDAYRIPWKDS